ncbi:hypothetical protein FCJ60_11550 [Burkholderia metallica]|nr:hypothetical protein [Burkholderia metallica]
MLTICRQCRLPKGSRKPVVGPVACYRGVEVNNFRICVRGVCEAGMDDGPDEVLFIPSYRGRVDRVPSGRESFSASGGRCRRDRRLRNLHKVRASASRDKWGAKDWPAAGKADLSFSRRAIVGTMPRAVGRPSETREKARPPHIEKRTTRRILRAWQIKNSLRARSMSRPPRG